LASIQTQVGPAIGTFLLLHHQSGRFAMVAALAKSAFWDRIALYWQVTESHLDHPLRRSDQIQPQPLQQLSPRSLKAEAPTLSSEGRLNADLKAFLKFDQWGHDDKQCTIAFLTVAPQKMQA
jgi:hypothetical protein